jgi:hypothetical protein
MLGLVSLAVTLGCAPCDVGVGGGGVRCSALTSGSGDPDSHGAGGVGAGVLPPPVDPTDPPEPAPDDVQVLITHDPLTGVDDPLAGSSVQSCALWQDTRCEGGRAQRCAAYDVDTGAFVAPTGAWERALWFERWLEMFHQPDGQVMERQFNRETAPGLPEYTWGDPQRFQQYTGKGDAAIWTGVALLSGALRFATTGTDADRELLRARTEAVLTLFEVTGFPGYLARYHYLLVDGTMTTPDHVIRNGTPDFLDNEIVTAPPGLSAGYGAFVDLDGVPRTGTPMWYGNPSIDQYSGVLSSLPAAVALLDDPAVTARAAEQIACTLNRLERLDIVNLDQNEAARDALAAVLQGPLGLDLEAGDVDPLEQDRLVLYVMRQYNPSSSAPFEEGCPAAPAVRPSAVIDAASKEFVVDLFSLVADLDPSQARPTSIDHFYAPNVRGADAVHLLHLAAAAMHLTGDPIYDRFASDVLIEEFGAAPVAQTLGALTPPQWCRQFYGEHIAALPLWDLLALLEDGPLRDEMAQAMVEELWTRQALGTANAKLAMMMVGEVPAEVVPDRAGAVAIALEALAGLGGNGGVLLEPRRSYTRPFAEVEADLPAGNAAVCPTEEERAACEQPLEIYGISLGATLISSTCRGLDSECVMADGTCTTAIAASALPVELRSYADDLWQRSPFQVGDTFDVDGGVQSPGLDLIELYWLARYYGWTDEGAGTVLAWQDEGACAR